jgi:predicted nuclease of predicted toxin-antitoxin system
LAIPGRTRGRLALIGKFLIDECLSIGLTATAKARGHQADHVAHLGKSGWQDWNLVTFALETNYTFVTNNRSDFLKRYANVDLHAGLVIIIPNVKGSEQSALFERALDVVEAREDITNMVIEVELDGRVTAKDWSNLG